MLHYTAKDIYQPLIIAPYFNRTTGNLSIYATSDLWEDVTGTAKLTWYDWRGQRLPIATPATVDFHIGAINTTRLLQTNTTQLLRHHDPTNVILHMSLTAHGRLPNTEAVRTFTHENWFHPTALKTARLLDPGLSLTHSRRTRKFSVTATRGVAAWVWLDHPAGPVLNFDANAFWLAPGQTREIGYTVKKDSTGGKWVEGVTVQSLWNQTLSE